MGSCRPDGEMLYYMQMKWERDKLIRYSALALVLVVTMLSLLLWLLLPISMLLSVHSEALVVYRVLGISMRSI